MRILKTAAVFFAAITLLNAKKVTSPTTSGGNDDIGVEATISLTEAEVTQKLGADPGDGIVLVAVRITPKAGKMVRVSPDDFILLAHDDGERSKPFDPAEIAGQGALMVRTNTTGEKKKSSGFGGFGPFGMGGGGSPPPQNTTVASKMDPKNQGSNTLLEALRAKQLQPAESAKPIEGFLYFPLDGKHKLKNLAVLYRGPAGKLNLEFQH